MIDGADCRSGMMDFAKPVLRAGEGETTSSVKDLEQIYKEEKKHFELLQTAITELGGDATVETRSADVAGILSHGILQMVTDPRTTIALTLQAILTAEIMDNDGRQILIELAGELGQTRLKEQCQRAKDAEQIHLQTVHDLLSSMTLKEANFENALFESSGVDFKHEEHEKAPTTEIAPIKNTPRKTKRPVKTG